MNTSVHVRAAIDGDAESLAWVIRHFQPLVEAQVRMRLGGRGGPEDVEDLVQETWVVALQRLRDLEERSGRMVPVLVRFLGSTALNLCNNFLRRHIRRVRSAPDAAIEDDAPRPQDRLARSTRGVLTRVVHDELADVIRAHLERMGAEQRDVLVYRLLESRSNVEIAEILGISANLVAVRYRRAMQELRRALPAEVADEMEAARGEPE